MEPITLLSEHNRDSIMNYIQNYAADERYNYNDGIHFENNIEFMLRFWNKAKEPLLPMFGNKLMAVKHIKHEKSTREIADEIDEFITKTAFYNKFTVAAQTVYEYGNEGKQNMYFGMMSMTYPSQLSKVFYDSNEFIYKGVKITKGMKIMKCLRKLSEVMDIPFEDYEELRIKISKVFEDKTMDDTLVLSIHPLDYMTMSDNDYGWSSCMNWMNCGEYRLGTVEMMNSPCVVVAYLAGKRPFSIQCDEYWTNKRWRELFIVTPNFISGIKEYPYENEIVHNAALDFVKELATNAQIGHYRTETVEISNYIWTTYGLFDAKKIKVQVNTNFMYNDYGRLKHNVYLGVEAPDELIINYSGETECMKCGKELSPFEDISSSFLIGPCCCDYVYCGSCDEWVPRDTAWYDERSGYWYCQYCADEHFQECGLCGEYVHEDNIHCVYVIDKAPAIPDEYAEYRDTEKYQCSYALNYGDDIKVAVFEVERNRYGAYSRDRVDRIPIATVAEDPIYVCEDCINDAYYGRHDYIHHSELGDFYYITKEDYDKI